MTQKSDLIGMLDAFKSIDRFYDEVKTCKNTDSFSIRRNLVLLTDFILNIMKTPRISEGLPRLAFVTIRQFKRDIYTSDIQGLIQILEEEYKLCRGLKSQLQKLVSLL